AYPLRGHSGPTSVASMRTAPARRQSAFDHARKRWRKARGERPVARRKVRMKLERSPNPTSKATSVTGSRVSRRSFAARRSRAARSDWCGVAPTAARKERRKWKRVSRARSASVASERGSPAWASMCRKASTALRSSAGRRPDLERAADYEGDVRGPVPLLEGLVPGTVGADVLDDTEPFAPE